MTKQILCRLFIPFEVCFLLIICIEVHVFSPAILFLCQNIVFLLFVSYSLQQEFEILFLSPSFFLSFFLSFVHSFIHSFIHSFLHSFLHSFILSFFLSSFSFIQSFVCSFFPFSFYAGILKIISITGSQSFLINKWLNKQINNLQNSKIFLV